MTPSAAFDYLGRSRRVGTKLGLANITALARMLGNPECRCCVIHIAGTNGKGSTSAFCESILRTAGYRVGLFTSPHLINLGERIQVDRVPMTPEEIGEGIGVLEPMIEEVARTPGLSEPTFFEIMTALGLWQFARREVEWIVWETGLGGRLDSTNFLTPDVSVITSIGYDHTAFLGDTLELIAMEKAGIIKPGVPVVSGVTQPEAKSVIRRRAEELGAPFIDIDPEESAPSSARLRVGEISNGRQLASIGGTEYRLGLLGEHQVRNAACARAALHAAFANARFLGQIAPDGARPDLAKRLLQELHFAQGLAEARWSGRFEILHRDPPLVVDGAHNQEAVEALAATWRAAFGESKCHLITGALADKNYEEMSETLRQIASGVTLVGLPTERTATPEALQAGYRDLPCEVFPTLAAAWPSISARFGREPILATGSLFLAGEFLARHRGETAVFSLNERLTPPPKPNAP